MAFAVVASIVARDSWEVATSFLAVAKTLEVEAEKLARCFEKRTLRGVEEEGGVVFLEGAPEGVLAVERI